MKRSLFSIILLLSSTYITPVCADHLSCPCVSKNGTCCCIAENKQCCCAQEYAKEGTVPATCPCPKTAALDGSPKKAANPVRSSLRATTAHIAVSYGDLFDKITILEIKKEQISDLRKLEHIVDELESLNRQLTIILAKSADRELLGELKEQLKEVNWQLWQAEDAIRLKEREKLFDAEFITIARSIYAFNDDRAALKRQISDLLHSRIVEEKSYAC